MEHVDIFKETISVKKFTGDLDIINKHIQHIVEYDPGRKVSNIGGYQSNDITFGFKELIYQACEGIKELKLKVNLMNFWLNINKGQDSNICHIHSSDDLSVVYYHQVCCEECPIRFTHLVPQIKHDWYEIRPKNQDMLFFSGLLPHSVIPCGNIDHTRISLAFNFRIL